MGNHLKAYLRVWLRLTANQFQMQVANARGAAVIFILGKLLRLALAWVLLYVVVGRAKLLAGYTLPQATLLLLIFNFIQTLSQLFLRGVYLFRQKVVDGTFDFYLLNPLSELFYSLFSQTDPMDVLVTIPYLILMLTAWVQAGYPLTLPALFVLFCIIIVVMIWVTALHIVIMSIGIRYLEVDNTIMLYRDLERMGAFPTNMYGKYGEFLLNYLAPFGLMATIPANLVFGHMNILVVPALALIAWVSLRTALWLWRHALRTYTSASS